MPTMAEDLGIAVDDERVTIMPQGTPQQNIDWLKKELTRRSRSISTVFAYADQDRRCPPCALVDGPAACRAIGWQAARDPAAPVPL